jgi:hypothetical protein
LAFAKPFFILYKMKEDKEYKKEKRTQRAKQKALERQADELLKRDEEAQKLREQGNKIDVDKFKKLI